MNTAKLFVDTGSGDGHAVSLTPEVSLSRVAQIDASKMPGGRWATTLTFLGADLVGFSIVLGCLYITLGWIATQSVLPILGLLGIAYCFAGLYRAANMHPAEEIRRVTIVTTIFFAACFVSLWIANVTDRSMILFWGITCFYAIVIVPASRAISRVMFSRASWWGTPVVVLSSGDAGDAVVKTLKRWPELGFKPVAVLQDVVSQREIGGIPVIGEVRLAPYVATQYNIPCAIIASPRPEQREIVDLLGKYTKFFRRVLVIPSIRGATALWSSGSYAGLIGYGVQHSSWSRWGRASKRMVDLIGATVTLIVLAPVLLTIALLIKIDSPGPVIFTQMRLGKGGRCFKVLKFRTMYVDADAMLQQLLRNDPALLKEYMVFRKLRDDPRVTPMGKLLRKYSLDELPQFLNVLLGQMSLVGPRAYLPKEISSMDGLERIVLQNRPGITGLWQVSGRNLLSFEQRVEVDVHYVHHWNPWVDLYILARTIPVVLTGEGAC